jgi:uncharacterized protein (TIGR02757 family)
MSLPAPLARRSPAERAALKRRLERLYRTFDRRYLASDPLAAVHAYTSEPDREVVGLLASGFAFGNVKAIQASLAALLPVMGGSPSAFVVSFDAARDRRSLDGLGHRWIRADDVGKLLGLVRLMRERCGRIGGFFMEGHRPDDPDIGPSLASFSERALDLSRAVSGHGSVAKFFPSPRAGSACKRLNLYLRWMVRDGDGLDLGLWKGISRRQLVLPLDTHLIRISRALGLTARRSPGWRMAVEATRSLALLDPDDPVKYDFALSRLGILDRCLHGRDPLDCRRCGTPAVRVLGGGR